MVSLLRNLFKAGELPGLFFERPLVVLQSDGWGRAGVRDKEGYEQLRSSGIKLGQHPYDLYSLETADDVNQLAGVLLGHKDSTGRRPCLVMNVSMANLDFGRMRSDDYKKIHLMRLGKGLPGRWSRPGLFDAYRSGVEKGVFYPALHGLTHFCPLAIENVIAADGEQAALLRSFWAAETPFIYWRMPWVGYEYWNPEKPQAGFLSGEHQARLIVRSVDYFYAFFRLRPFSACAPGHQANEDTHRAWVQAGIRVAQNGISPQPPHIDELGILQLYRTLDFEPSQREVDADRHMEIAGTCFSRGLPLIISIHSINFHSTLKDYRSPTLALLDKFLTALERRYPEMLYVNDKDLYQIVTSGSFKGHPGKISVTVRKEEQKTLAVAKGAS
jgi:hypothetical protein